MLVIKNENVVPFDIDDTLLMWDNPTVNGFGKLPINFAGRTVYLTPHNYHVDLLKVYHERGYYIIFWSANGYNHAVKAVLALGLEGYADGVNGHIQSKPCKHVDDTKDSASILGPRVYCEDLTKPIYTFIEYPPVGTVMLDVGVLNGR
jgi:hydroxymethylpyrimidine pyrophosphatase-like HAD family hydrolase